MKKIFTTFLILAATFFHCQTGGEMPAPTTAARPTGAKKPVLNIVLNDLTASCPHLVLNRDEITRLLAQDSAVRPAVQAAAIRIATDSRHQTPWVSERIETGLRPISGNVYARERGRQANAAARPVFEKSCEALADSLAGQLLRTHDEQQTDLFGALELAQTLAAQPVFEGFDIRLIIVSDLIHDLRGGATAKGWTVRFPPNVQVFTIGASTTEAAAHFPANVVTALAAFEAQFFIY